MDMTQSRRASQRRTSATGSVGGWNASTKLADSAFMPSRGASKTASPNGDVSSHGWNMYEKRGLEEIHVLVSATAAFS